MGTLKAGTARVNITPYVGINLSGFGGRTKPSIGIHDELHAKALVLDDGATKVGIVSCDLLNLDESSVTSIREKAQESTEIDGENIFISTTHTHSGPLTSPLRGFGKLDREWVSVLEKKIAGAISIANSRLRDAEIGAGKGHAEINLNRREKRDERVVIGVNPEGAIDREVNVVKINDVEQNPICTIANYACHPVVLGGSNYLLSADYPGYAMGFVERAQRRESVAMFLNGTTGDLNPIRVGKTFQEAEQRGTTLGAEVVKVLYNIDTSPDVEIRMAKEKVELQSGELPPADELEKTIEDRKKEIEKSERSADRDIILPWAQDALRMVKRGKKSAIVPVEVQALRIGDIILVGLPGEVFVEIGLGIKDGSPFKNTLVAGYTNGCIGYMPTKKAFEEGGYETHSSFRLYGIYPVDQDVAEKMVSSSLRLIDSIK